MILGLIIAGRFDRPFKYITPIQDFEDLHDGRTYTLEKDNTYHFNEIADIVKFDPADAIDSLAGSYFKIPNDCIEYIRRDQ